MELPELVPFLAGFLWAAMLMLIAHQVTICARRRLEEHGGLYGSSGPG
jgi:hypothetical protein